MNVPKPRGGKRLKLTLTHFQVETIASVASALDRDGEGLSEREQQAWRAIARVTKKALAYNDARRAKAEVEPLVDEHVL